MSTTTAAAGVTTVVMFSAGQDHWLVVKCRWCEKVLTEVKAVQVQVRMRCPDRGCRQWNDITVT